MGNFVALISGGQFSRIYYGQAHEQSHNTIQFIIGPIDFVKVERSPEIFECLEQVGSKSTKMKPTTMKIILHIMLCFGETILP